MGSGASGGDPRERQPLVARPDDVRCFGHERRAGIAEVGPSGRLRLDSIARWAQDVAWADVEDAGLRALTLWLVRRTRIRVNRFPRMDGRYALQTYVTGVGRMWAERRTDIVRLSDGDVARHGDGRSETPDVEIACIWVHLDPERLLPSPVHQVELDMWTGPSTRPVKARLRHPPPQAGAVARPWALRAAELDIAGHVNNAAYLTPIDDELLSGEPVPERIDVEVEYRTPAQAGPARLLSAGAWRWMVGAQSGEVHASYALRAADARLWG